MSAATATTDPATAYRIVSRVHIAQWDNALQQAVQGWELKALWLSTGTILPVFLPDAQYTPENVDLLIRHAGEVDDRIHALGR